MEFIAGVVEKHGLAVGLLIFLLWCGKQFLDKLLPFMATMQSEMIKQTEILRGISAHNSATTDKA